MPSPLQWIFQLVDRVSGPATVMAKTVEKYDAAVTTAGVKTDHETKRMGSAWDKFLHQVEHSNEHTKKKLVEGIAEKFAILEIVKLGIEGLGEMAEKAAELGVEFAKDAIHAADFDRTSRIGMTALLGSAEKAEELMAGAKSFALEAGVPMKETMQAYQNLALHQVAPKNIPILLQASTDLSQLSGHGNAGMAAFAETLGDIQSKGQLGGRALMQLANSGISMDILAKKLGVLHGGFDVLRKQLEATPVSAGKGTRAILETLAQIEGGKLGQVTKDVGKGWEGSVEKLKTSWEIFLGKLEQTGAFDRLLNIVNRITAAFDPATASGKRMGKIFEDLFVSLGRALEPLTKPGVIEGLVKSLADIAKYMGVIAGFGLKSGGLFAALTVGDKASKHEATKKAVEIGKQHSLGLGIGIAQAAFNPIGAATTLAGEVISAVRQKAQIHSPSKVMEELGMFTAEGFSLGLERGGLENSVELNMPKRGPGGRSGSGGPSLHVHQEFHISADRGMDPEELAHRIAEISQSGLQSALEQLGIGMGTAVAS